MGAIERPETTRCTPGLIGGRVILDNYIIRIYRRDKADPRLMVGTVEEIGKKEKKGFNSFDELREILVTKATRVLRGKGVRGRKKEEHRRATNSAADGLQRSRMEDVARRMG